jgi:lipopolysaccharide biosynthesis glycosyltransferase
MKIAFTTILDDKFLAGFLITLNSILITSPNFNYDIIILEWGDLSDESKNIIKKLYKNVIFKIVDVDLYKNHKYDETFRKWTYNCNYRFDIFTFTEYDRVVFFDSDMIFEIDMEELLSYDVDFGASGKREIGEIQQIGDMNGFDAGVMTIGKKYLNKKTRDELLKIANSPAPDDVNVKTNNWVSDEPILNTYFLDKITRLPEGFNFLVSKTTDDKFKNLNNYHFTGHNKPWYGTTLNEQFDNSVFFHIQKNTGNLMMKIILKKILSKYYKQKNILLSKGIDIDLYSNYIKPILSS